MASGTQPVQKDDIQDDTKRSRTLTEEGEELYETNRAKFLAKVSRSWRELEKVLTSASDCPTDMKSLTMLEHRLVTTQDKYFFDSKDYVDFLYRASTEVSKTEIDKHITERDKNKDILTNVFDQIAAAKQKALETLTVASEHRSVVSKHGSNWSDTSSILQRKRAKAEAQRARLAFIAKEAEILKEKAEQESKSKATSERKKAELDANLHVLKHEAETVAAEAEVQALEDSDRDSLVRSALDFDQTDDRSDRTVDYVKQQAEFKRRVLKTPSPGPPIVNPTPGDNYAYAPSIQDSIQPLQGYNPSSILNPDAARFIPKTDAVVPNGLTVTSKHNEDSVVTNLTQFLLRKDLVLSRFTNFNDRPENFSSWKASFRSVVRELNVSAFEEMDLLVKWLGPVSSASARSIRSANAENPERGVEKIWERLEDRYGRPEMVESALKTKLNNFPKITTRDYGKLFELSDILSEIESCKENPKYATLLSYFDSSSGVNQIVSKLPFSIQGKWTSRASKYKSERGVSFPPFSFFVEFVRDMSKMFNDPGFVYDGGQSGGVSTFRKVKDFHRGAERVSTNFTKLSRAEENSDSEKFCPLHRTSKHSLAACRKFKLSTLHERRTILMDKGICSRCCVSTKHTHRNCREVIKCLTCGSTRHASPMHVDPAVISQSTDVASHGGETTEKELVVKCTQLCGEFSGRSCSKTLLVNVYPEGQPELATKVYAIIDVQSNRSLVRSELLDRLGDCSEPYPYTLRSCSGSVPMVGRRARGYTIQALDGSESMRLPVLVECNDIPNDKSEIVIPDIVSGIPHLKQLESVIPPFDTKVDIQLLIGRDLVEAHQVLQQITGPESTPFAQRLRLGWVVVGEVCLGTLHKPDNISVLKTRLLSDGRCTIFDPCENSLQVKDTNTHDSVVHDRPYDSIFQRSKDDNKVGLSIEDRQLWTLSFARTQTVTG